MSVGGQYPDDWDQRRRTVYERDDYRCQKCGAGGGPYGDHELHAHHRVPISKGESHDLSNLTTVCATCHEEIHGHEIGSDSPLIEDWGPVTRAIKWILTGIGGVYIVGSLVFYLLGAVILLAVALLVIIVLLVVI